MTPDAAPVSYAVVVPTVGRPSLTTLLDRLAAGRGPRAEVVVVVDDRRGGPAAGGAPPLVDPWLAARFGPGRLVVAVSGGRGPAAARNVGWRLVPRGVGWVAFLDDDVEPDRCWSQDLAADLLAVTADRAIAGTQGRVEVPLPAGRRPTDGERGTAALADAWWITADMAYRRAVLESVGGFDERFRRAFREDSDLALRVQDTGHRLVAGDRRVVHPARVTSWSASVRAQRGNADDVLMRRVHGPWWRDRAHDHGGRGANHAATVAAAGLGVVASWRRRPLAATWAGSAWLLLTVAFAVQRIAPGPRDRAELGRMVVSSVLIPPVAVWWWCAGWLRPARARGGVTP